MTSGHANPELPGVHKIDIDAYTKYRMTAVNRWLELPLPFASIRPIPDR